MTTYSPQTTQRRIACLWLPNWPIQRLVVARPELRCQKLVLYFQDTHRGQFVKAVSPAASQLGVRCGMPLSEAKSLLQRGTKSLSQKGSDPLEAREELSTFSLLAGEGLTPFGIGSKQTQQPFYLLEHEPDADLQALSDLADGLTPFSPLIGLEDDGILSSPTQRSSRKNQSIPNRPAQPNSILLDVTGIDRLYGGDDRLAEELYQHLRQLNYLPRLAIADTLAVAWGMSHFATDSWIVVPPADDTSFAQLPLPALRLHPQTVATLHQLGIETISQLRQIPRSELAMRFGDQIHRRLDQAAGHLAEPIVARHPPTPFIAHQVLDYPISHQPTLIIIIDRLVTELCQQMKSRQQGGLQWSVCLILVDSSPLRMMVNLFQPSADPAEVVPLIEMQLESQWRDQAFKHRAPQLQSAASRSSASRSSANNVPPLVQEVVVQVSTAVLLVPRQRKLFDESPRLDKLGLAQLINRLASRLGGAKVVAAELRSGVQPEFACRFQPLVGQVNRRQGRNKRSKSQSTGSQAADSCAGRSESHQAARPLRIFRPAMPIELSSWKIQRRWGPERIETGWWRGPTVRRNYWRIEIETGQHFWVYQDLRSEQWFLQGEF